MLHPNALKVTMLFPIFGNDDAPFPPDLWDWWLVSIVSIGAYHEFFTRGAWEGRLEYHRCVTLVLQTEHFFRRHESGLVRTSCTSRPRRCTSDSFNPCAITTLDPASTSTSATSTLRNVGSSRLRTKSSAGTRAGLTSSNSSSHTPHRSSAARRTGPMSSRNRFSSPSKTCGCNSVSIRDSSPMTETKQKRGRPVRTAPRVAVTWRLPVNLLVRVGEVADAEGVTTTAWVERAIETALDARRPATPDRT